MELKIHVADEISLKDRLGQSETIVPFEEPNPLRDELTEVRQRVYNFDCKSPSPEISIALGMIDQRLKKL